MRVRMHTELVFIRSMHLDVCPHTHILYMLDKIIATAFGKCICTGHTMYNAYAAYYHGPWAQSITKFY